MKLSNVGTAPVYTVSGPSLRSLPDWLAQKKKRGLKHDPEFANRVELLQDFEFTGASSCIRVSEDGEWVMSTGTFPPQIHVHNLYQMSLSFSRHTVSLNNKFVLCSTDYSKSIHLQEDRRIEFHTPNGCHYHVRIPRFGRDIVYDRRATEVLVPAAGLDGDGQGEVFRLNLELGRFQKSYQIDVGSDDGVERGLQGSIGVGCVNTAAIAEQSHGLSAFGTSLGSVEFWDTRSRARVATLQTHDGEITALDFSRSGLSLATGSSTGIVQMYDLRRPTPLLTKDLGFGARVNNLIHMTTSSDEKMLLASDRRAIKIFDVVTGDPWATIEPEVDISAVAHCPDSGMLLSANEGRQQHAWFIPMLGPAPKWCTFLERLVDEMAEEVSSTTYDNYKFLTLPELRALSLSHLVGKTNLLRPYMHGFFVASKLYDQARLIANPHVYEEERMKRVKEKIEKERATRIRETKKVKVNQKTVDALLKKQEKRQKVDAAAGLLGDDRLGAFFEDEELAIDETTAEFRALNPSTRVDAQGKPALGKPAWQPMRSGLDESDSDGEDEKEEEAAAGGGHTRSGGAGGSDGVVMRMTSSAPQFGSRGTIGARVQKSAANSSKNSSILGQTRKGKVVGERSVTFVPESAKKKPEQEEVREAPKRDNRTRRSASGNTFRNLKK
ncbi:ribosome biogenesis protein ENP2 [Sporothrix brasiliensis 5110]|uniref:Ribosome biogenesis protein ENP2 n=1 Tax=Sporothrix brasiliensis 5110 TaxID=1398154 RepID=A0A0C2IT73_9PEZI|nr:ribosome biogenesis protein ENP2 [Sporothrix brasiliensis 5110]KIH88207.1 ribosome biogenesis protein ENP2 [Sporothrix brasiliensis 5110]